MNESVNRPNLRQLRIQAKDLRKAVQAGDQVALARVMPFFKQSVNFGLAEAQLVIARELGFNSWPELQRQHKEDSPTKSPAALFFGAIEAGREEEAIELLAEEPELAGLSRKTEWGWATAMHVAAEHGLLGVVNALIELGSPVYPVNQHDYPPLFYAFSAERHDVVNRLMEASMERDEGQPPTYGCGVDIGVAGRLGMLDRVKMHLERDPLAVYRRGCIGESVLHWPAHNNHVEIVRLLLDSGAPIEADEIGLYGGKPLHWAAEHAPGAVELLLARGANPNSRNLKSGSFEGFTPLHMMASQKEQELDCARRLLVAGADPSLLDANGRTPLQVAIDYDWPVTVEFLSQVK